MNVNKIWIIMIEVEELPLCSKHSGSTFLQAIRYLRAIVTRENPFEIWELRETSVSCSTNHSKVVPVQKCIKNGIAKTSLQNDDHDEEDDREREKKIILPFFAMSLHKAPNGMCTSIFKSISAHLFIHEIVLFWFGSLFNVFFLFHSLSFPNTNTRVCVI